jgi:hypothetical protein
MPVYGLIDGSHRYPALIDEFGDCLLEIAVLHAHIDAGIESQFTGVMGVGGYAMVYEFMMAV